MKLRSKTLKRRIGSSAAASFAHTSNTSPRKALQTLVRDSSQSTGVAIGGTLS